MRKSLLLLSIIAAGPLSAQQVGPIFKDGEAQIVPAFADSNLWIRQQLWVETGFDTDGDGRPDRMHVDVTRPAQTATGLKVAVIYETSPYFAGTVNDASHLWDVRQEVDAPPPPRESQAKPPYDTTRTRISNSQVNTWVPRGFAVVHSESPGTGLSDGCPTVGGPNEELAPAAVIDWLNGRALGFTSRTGGTPVVATWSTGKVGMTGTSYNGTLPIAAATTGVPGLEAIIPISPNTSYYHYYRSNGLIRHPGGWLGEDMDYLYDFIDTGNPEKRLYCDANVREGQLDAGHDRTTGDWNSFWAARDYWGKLDGIKAATLLAHGFNDWNVMPIHSIHVFKELEKRGVPAKIYLHQGGHGGPPPLPLMNRWFSHFLYGVDNGVEKGPKAYIVREDASRNDPTPYADWPVPGSQQVSLHPTPGGAAIGGLSSVPTKGSVAESFSDDVDSSATDLAKAATSGHRLIYATAPLTKPIHISGTPRVTVKMSINKPAANLSAYLVALPWTDAKPRQANFSLITREWADLQNHASLSQGTPLVPGQFVEMSFDLQPDDQIIPAGKRIALMIFSSDRDFTLWPKPGTVMTLDLSGTTITLPVVGGAAALRAAGVAVQ